MLISTFQHLKGIGVKREKEFWRSGILSWKDFIEKEDVQLSLFGQSEGRNILSTSLNAFEEEDANYFARLLPAKEHYRIALAFPQKTLFLDIETTGLSRYYDKITLVGWSMGGLYDVWIRGGKDSKLKEAIAEAKAIVTFNGTLFDIPFLIQEFKDLKIPLAHVDLRFFSKRIGLSGGQKKIEKEIGIQRSQDLLDLEGDSAPILWHKYRLGDLNALKLLISYNHADIEGMKEIFDFSVHSLFNQHDIPFQTSTYLYFSDLKSEIIWSTQESEKTNEQEGRIKIRPCVRESVPSISADDLIQEFPNLESRIIGIDLTGSKERPSGWCLLDGKKATTDRLSSDDDIIQATLSARPSLVSIDSPLSLPSGRKFVSDDDPGRKDFGITRLCERILKKRGINVYPCLIQSMQGLTARGIRLANRFRELGVPVIESYPGAAQDIMNIPRKGASIDYLKMGLGEFGIMGSYLNMPVSHDELDAITSSVVGLFFLARKFEALGNDEEGYLIVPSVDKSKGESMKEKRKIIGVSGPIASGKTSVGKFLEANGFHYGRFSLVLADILRSRGIQPDRKSLQAIGEEIHEDPGQRWLCQQLIRKLPDTGNIVIDGLRFLEDHASLIEAFGLDFFHIHVKAPKVSRLDRYIARGGSPEEFEQADSHLVESSVNDLASVAHLVINNDNSEHLLLERVKQFIDCQTNTKEDAITCL
jgi:uncharacterized protein YprB with RNaseH-like and TPR domain/predicted nuclease with RNAse H fold/dephospho-CoA kinase